MTLFLIKWYGYTARLRYSPSDRAVLPGLANVIVGSKEWLIANTTAENGFEGWGRLIPAIGGHINIYDTAFVSLVPTHGTGFSDFRPAQLFSSPEVKEAIDGKYPRIPATLTNNEFRREGGWVGERGESEPETGATSYALLSLLKH